MYGMVRLFYLCLCCLVMAPAYALTIDAGETNAAIQQKIDNAADGEHIIFSVGTYYVNLNLNNNLVLRGDETARTFLFGQDSSQPVVVIDGGNDITIKHLHFGTSRTGIEVRGSSNNIEIINSLFQSGGANTGILITDSSVATIRNNTFHGNGTGVSRDTGSGVIEYNIFSNNQTGLIASSTSGINFNCYANNSSDGELGQDAVISGATLEFANSTESDLDKRDFHLQEGSLCIDIAPGTDVIDDSEQDAGAYGGNEADTRPYPVTNLTTELLQDNGSFAIQLSWAANKSYLITRETDPGLYMVYYDNDRAAPPYDGIDAKDAQGGEAISGKIEVSASATSYALHALTGTATVPDAPVIAEVVPASEELFVSWQEVTNATDYAVYYTPEDTGVEEMIRTSGEVSITLRGLRNNISYSLTLTALRQKHYYVTVKAVDSLVLTGQEITDAPKSDYATVQKVAVGDTLESARSDEWSGIPESLLAYPQLKNEGCFIATAAFSFYDADEIKPLRQFRDQYLLTNKAGSNFVRWYYDRGPVAAHWLQNNSQYKPIVRLLLAPVIAFAWMTVNYLEVSFVLIVTILLTMITFQGKRYLRRRLL